MKQFKVQFSLQQFLDNELNNNQEKEKKISAAERQAAKLRLQFQNLENERIQLHDEVLVNVFI